MFVSEGAVTVSAPDGTPGTPAVENMPLTQGMQLRADESIRSDVTGGSRYFLSDRIAPES